MKTKIELAIEKIQQVRSQYSTTSSLSVKEYIHTIEPYLQDALILLHDINTQLPSAEEKKDMAKKFADNQSETIPSRRQFLELGFFFGMEKMEDIILY